MSDTGIKRESKFYICETPQNSDILQAAYEGLTWVEVENIVTLPDFGYTVNSVVQDYVNTDMSQARKGFKQGASSDLVIGHDPDATGQDALKVAAETRGSFAMKMELSNSPDPLTKTNTIMYSRGTVGGWNFNGGGGEDFDNITTTITLNQTPIIVAPEAI